MLKPWWEEWPGRLEYEESELDAAGVDYQLDEEAFRSGKIVLHLQVPQDGVSLRLDAHFPDVYPYTRFELIAPELDLAHHQNPIGKNLCLIGRASENWNIDDTLADFIKNRLPNVLKAGQSNNSAEVDTLEEHQAEPASDYYPYQPGAMLLVDSAWNIARTVHEGKLTIGIEGVLQPLVRGVVLEVKDSARNTLAKSDDTFPPVYVNHISGVWVRCETAPFGKTPKDTFELLQRQNDFVSTAAWCPVKEGRIRVIAAIFPEEIDWRRQVGDGWLFIIHFRRAGRGLPNEDVYYYTRAGRAGRVDLAVRTPRLQALPQKKVAIVGLGCMGAPSAIEFAKAGIGELRLVDQDFVEPGTVSRWPLGLAAAGSLKTEALHEFLRRHYPYTKIQRWAHMVGAAMKPVAGSDLVVLNDLLGGVDMLYDATAEIGIQHLLADVAAANNIPHVSVSTTPGGWGGRVARILPGPGRSCWMCLRLAEESGEIPGPPGDPDGAVQPAGCATPTFTGAGFDTMEPVLAAVRLAVATLCRGTGDGYPDSDWDIAIVSLRDAVGSVIAPRWETRRIGRQPSCEACKSK
jgi:molybdopterin/thiamine biosynthesis adenylyltransferase